MREYMTDSEPTLRAFFAIDLPELHKEIIFNQIIVSLGKNPNFRNTHWAKPENLHITLQFMPAIKLSDVEKIVRMTQTELQNYKPFDLKLEALELFPSAQHPRIISLAVTTEHNELADLSKKLGEILMQFNYPIELRSFRAHLTLGKLKTHLSETTLKNTAPLSLNPIAIESIILFESRHTKDESRYIPLADIHFAK
jgi:2'-5' RNA ligase